MTSKPKFDFVYDIGKLSLKKKKVFYLCSANYLSTCVRDALANDILNPTEKLDQLKYINEVNHRLLNRSFDLEFGDNHWSEEDTWRLIKNIVNNKKEIKNYVGNALSEGFSLAKKLEDV